MQVKKVTLSNFRNYEQASVELSKERNILLGDNAQGKSNFLEAIELLSNGYSQRALTDSELIRSGTKTMHVELIFERGGVDETLSVAFHQNDNSRQTSQVRALEKKVKINGVTYSTLRPLRGRLATVGFKSEDLGLLRAGPKFRREWIDRIIVSIKPSMQDKFSRYQKGMSQRNRLLKTLFEKGRVSVTEQDELKVWDEQLAQYGAVIIKERLTTLEHLLPKAGDYQVLLSERQEVLSAAYLLRNSRTQMDFEEGDELNPSIDEPEADGFALKLLGFSDQASSPNVVTIKELAEFLMRSFKENRHQEIVRRQTLFGPHRDDISFFLSGRLATSFASQGQQRSLVLSMKLAELKLVTDNLQDPPILLLDDVLAELDLNRQSLLLSAVKDDVQTIISTTHLTGVKPEWFEKAAFIHVKAGTLQHTNAEP